VKLYAIVGGYFYNSIEGIASEDFLDQVMIDVDEDNSRIRFIEISEEEFTTYDDWISNRSMDIHREILGRPKLQARKVLGWRLE
jgi:hypothetical protein